MKYMDQVLDESLRMYPPIQRTDRVAGADYTYEDIRIQKGQLISISIYGLHHDSDVYPEPDKFRPERFDEASKASRDNLSFLPFGAGPRNCIGMRFATVEIKLMMASLLHKFRFERCEKTPVYIKLN
jgi:cytochrome P450